MSNEREKFDEWFRKTRYMMPKYAAMLDAWNARAAQETQLRCSEPVVWLYRGEPMFDGKKWHETIQVTTSEQVARWKDKDCRPLYAAPVAQAEQWQPIETAPKDGRAILVNAGGFSYTVEWSDEFDWWGVDDNKLGPFRLRGQAPTHWMPLPQPPKEQP